MSSPPIHYWLAGDDYSALRMNEIGAAISWLRNPPMVQVARASTGQAITSNTRTKISFDTVVNSYDPYGFYSAGSPDKLTITQPGWYSFELQFSAPITTDSRLIISLYKNGFTASEILFSYDQPTLPSGTNVNIRKENSLFFNAGDYIHYGIFCDAASFTTSIASVAERCSLRVRWVSN